MGMYQTLSTYQYNATRHTIPYLSTGLMWIRSNINEPTSIIFFSNYTIHRRHSQRMHTHPYEYTHTNPTPRSIFEDCTGKFSRLTKSPQTPRCRRERRLPLKAQTPLNPEKFAPRGVEPKTWGATRALVTTRLQALSPVPFCFCSNRGKDLFSTTYVHRRRGQLMIWIWLAQFARHNLWLIGRN
jgi:hypothetical protein